MAKQKDLIELSYLSEAVSDFSFLGLMQLLDPARTFNKKNGITGILLYDNQQFGQVIEGEWADVMKAWRRASKTISGVIIA
ncbi:BLUF domain-containing protein [Polynucleobacter necessarius]|uniref:BLUF domain-containing protein n=1 Tax=Polynucleobacter necessarius TaxID=576610 RepID=UPI001E28EDEF|nr:BLUF domain-containing protein [Polynucleobacter necessarius]